MEVKKAELRKIVLHVCGNVGRVSTHLITKQIPPPYTYTHTPRLTRTPLPPPLHTHTHTHTNPSQEYWHRRTVNNFKTFQLGGCYEQLKSVENMLLTVMVLGYLRQQGVFQSYKNSAEYYVAPADHD